MEDEGSVLLDGKALGNLRVVDLKQELEKRGLSKSGSKKDLVKRLKQQLEFEKLCGERKTTGDCDLKLELDADTEQNEFVQQYLAQKQKIYAEQKEVKRLIELEEIQKSGDERGSDSPRAEDASDHDTQDTSDGESQPEILQATSSIQEKEDKIDVDSSQVNKDKKQELIERGGIDCKKDLSPNILENIEQNTGANKVSALSESGVEKGITEVSKIVLKETKDSYQIKQVENISSFDKKIKDKEENIILKNEQDCKTEDVKGPHYKNETMSSIESPINLETEPKSIVSDILGSSDMQCETKDESKVSKELVSERTAVPVSEAVETEPRKQVLSPSDSSNEPVLENPSVSKQPSSEIVSSMTPSFSSETDKPSEKSRDFVMDPATEASPQLEFEKLRGERKTTGDCDLKLGLDADKEQNEFVQQYLAKKQKIYAEQKEKKRLIELEEIQKSGDEEGSDSSRAEDASDHDTQDSSDGESQPEILQATSSIQEKEDKIDVDSSQVSKVKKQKLIERGGIDCKKDLSPNILENIKQKTGANKVSALSESGVEKGTTEVSKIVMKETKDSSYQIKQVENISSFDKKIKDKEENRILKNEQDSKTEDGLGPRYKNKTKSSIKSPANLETEPKSIVSDILGSSDMQCETKDESKVSKELVSERTAVPISEAVETEPRKQVSSPSDSSNEPVLENSSVSEQPSSELISSMTPSFSSKTDKPSEKSRDMVMDPATEASPKIEPQPPVKYVSTRKIRISGRKLSEKSEEEPKVKRGKWGNFSSSQKSQAINISTDSLKNWFPDFKLLKNPDVINEAIEEMQVVSKEENSEHQIEKIDESKNTSQNIDMKDEQAPVPVAQIDESEATTILFIQNLVRPFTLLQLKELLKETGHFIEEKFWIDKIKSKCFVTYSTVEEAIKTKTALNGTRWPSSNPKILSVEYSTEEELELHQSGSEPPKSLPPPPIVENPEPLEEHSLEDARRKDREHLERRRERSKPQPVREWDKNKLTQESPNRERVARSIERSRSSDKKEKKDTKRRPNEDTPAKLLDDLFQKTKSSPCIYWLPLTEEQVVEREEARRLRRLEREKRNQLREQEVAEQKAKAEQSRNRTREMERRRSSTRSRSPVSRRR